MELQLYLEILKRRALVIIIVTAAALLVLAASVLIIPPEYEAQSTIRVLLDPGITDLVMREDYNTRLLNTYANILKSDATLSEALERLYVPASSSSVIKDVSVDIVPNTELLTISVLSRDRYLAQDLANTLSTLLIDYSQSMFTGTSKSTQQIVEEQLVGLNADLQEARQERDNLITNGGSTLEIDTITQQIQFLEDSYDRMLDRYELVRLNETLHSNSITVLTPATLPDSPSNGINMVKIALTLVVGLFAGVGFGLVLENLDTNIHNVRQLERISEVPILGAVPMGYLTANDFKDEDITVQNKNARDAYRLLCTNLYASWKGANNLDFPNSGKILITSALAEESKDMVAINLARTFADQGLLTYLVECDLRNPLLSEKFNIDNHLGMSNLLVDHEHIDDVILDRLPHDTDQPRLFFINSGPKATNPPSLFTSSSFEKLLNYLEGPGQVIILDTPAVPGFADTSILASKVNGVILVIRQSITNQEAINSTLKQLNNVQAKLLGIVYLQNLFKV